MAFSATVTGAADTTVTWAVQEAGGGAVDAAGQYTAPAAGGTYHRVRHLGRGHLQDDVATVVVSPAAPMSADQPIGAATSSAGTASWAQDALRSAASTGDSTSPTSAARGPWSTTSPACGGAAQKILVALYMAKGDPYYQLNYRAASGYTPDDTPDSYALKGATSASGPWTALIAVAKNNNQYKSHYIADFSPWTFLRFRAGAAPFGCRVKMDVYDAGAGVTDGIVFYGDSITANIFQGGFDGFPRSGSPGRSRRRTPPSFPS